MSQEAKPKAKTKREINDMFVELYKEVSLKQGETCDLAANTKLSNEIFIQYDKIREHLSLARLGLLRAAGIE